MCEVEGLEDRKDEEALKSEFDSVTEKLDGQLSLSEQVRASQHHLSSTQLG